MESIFRNVDEDRTIENSKRILGEYRGWKLKARQVTFSLQSPSYEWGPKGQSYENTVDEKHARKMTAEDMFHLTERVIKAVEVDDGTAIYSKLLWFKYINHWTNVKCAERLNLPERTFSTYKRTALLMFAEAYPPVIAKLVVTKYKPEERSSFSFE